MAREPIIETGWAQATYLSKWNARTFTWKKIFSTEVRFNWKLRAMHFLGLGPCELNGGIVDFRGSRRFEGYTGGIKTGDYFVIS